MRKFSILMVVLMVGLLASLVMAGTYGDKATSKETEVSSVSGTMVCLGCELKKTEGAHAACADFGHTHVLKTSDGQMISLLENQYSKDLMGEKYHSQKVEVTGVMYANANVLDVESFKVDGKTKSWCGGCESMDDCSAK